jgi:hypothetical protein
VCVVVEAASPTPFVIAKAKLLLEFLIIALDPPAQVRQIEEAVEGDIVVHGGKPIFGRLGLALRPLISNHSSARGSAWFVALGIEDPVWDATTFTKNRDRLLKGDMAAQFLAAVLSQDEVKGLLSGEHFSVDGTLLEGWASLKSFRPKTCPAKGGGPGKKLGCDSWTTRGWRTVTVWFSAR